jgi:hypothetical protein
MTPSGAGTCGRASTCSPSCPTPGATPCDAGRIGTNLESSRDARNTNAEYLCYQTLVGTWPIEVERVGAFMAKATKEAKVYTSWIDPNADYDEALQRFVAASDERSGLRRGARGLPRGASPGRTRTDQLHCRKRRCCSLAQGSPTSIRAPSCGTSRSSTRIAGEP